MSTSQLIKTASDFEQNHKSFKSTSEKVTAVRRAKELVLSLNEIYKKNKDQSLMELMKKITAVKQKFDKRLKGSLI